MGFVVILHLPAERKSMLAEILMRWTTMQVIEGADGVRVEPNCVYVPPPHALVTMSEGRLRVVPSERDGGFRPIDCFLRFLGHGTARQGRRASYCPERVATARWD